MIKSEGRPGSTTLPRPPAHQRITDDLRRRIAAGEWKPGERLPTQQQLADEYGVSLQPVKAALSRLEWEGLLAGEQGKGVYVTERPAGA